MAEFIFKKMVEEEHLEDSFLISSAATSDEETGNPVYPPAMRILEAHGIDCSGKRAVRFQRKDYGFYDLIVCMDRHNVRNLLNIVGNDPYGKIRMLLDFTGHPADVADPWYTRDFDAAYQDIRRGCEALLRRLKKERKGDRL